METDLAPEEPVEGVRKKSKTTLGETVKPEQYQSNLVEWQALGHTNARSRANQNHSLDWTAVVWKCRGWDRRIHSFFVG